MRQPLNVSLFTTTLLFVLIPLLFPNVVGAHGRAPLRVLAQAATTADGTEVDRLFQEGVQQYRQGYYPKALVTYQRVFEIRRQQNDKAGIGQTLNNLGEVYYGLRQYDKAMEVLQQALVIRRELKDRVGEGETLDNIGLTYYGKDQNDQSFRNLWQQALAIRREVQDKAGEGKTLSNLGFIYSGGFKQYPKALESLQQALAIQQELGDKFLLGLTTRRLGIVYREMKDYPRAFEWLEKSLALSREVQNRAGEGNTLLQIGIIYSEQKKYEQAIAFYQQALSIARQIPNNQAQEAIVLRLIGSAYGSQGKKERLVEYYQQALVLQREINDKPAQLISLLLISLRYNSKAMDLAHRELYAQAKIEYIRSSELAQEVIVLARELKNREVEIAGLNNLGSAYAFFRDNQKALEIFQQVIKIAQEINAPDQEVLTLDNLGTVYRKQGNIRKLLEINLRQLEIRRKQNNPLLEASELRGAASIYNELGDAEKALELYQQALTITRKIDINQIEPYLRYAVLEIEISALNGLSSSYNALGNLNKALDFAQQAVNKAQSAGEPKYQVSRLLDLAALYSSGFQDFPKAIEIGQQALTIAQQSKEPELESNALEKLSDFYTNQGNQTLALKAAEQLLAIAKKVESPTLEQNALMGLKDVYKNQGNYQKALEFAQQYLALAQSKQTGYESVGLVNLSYLYVESGNPNKALEFTQKLLTIARRESNPSDEIYALLFTGLALKLQGKYDEGVKTTRQAVEIARKINNFKLEANSTVGLINIYEALGEFQNVITLTEPILPRIKQLDNPVLEAEALMNLGNAYGMVGNYTKGKELLNQGLAIVRRLKNPAQESRGLMLLGRLSSSLNDYQQALTQTQQSLEIAQKLQNPFLQIEPLYELGKIYKSLGDYNSSAKYYQQALKIAQQFNNPYNQGLALLNLADTSFAQGKPQEAVEFAQKSLTIFQEIKEPRLEAFTNRILSIGYGELGNDQKAMESAQGFLAFTRKVKNSVFEKQALSLIGSLHRKFGRKEQAIATYQEAQALVVNNQVTGGDAYIYAGLASIYRDLNQPNVAISYYKQSINGIEEIRRNIQGLPPELQSSFLQATVDFNNVKTADIYRQLADLLLSQGRTQEAQQVLELLKIQEIRDVARGGSTTTDKPNVPLSVTEAKVPVASESLIALGRQISECEQTNCKEKSTFNDKRTALVVQFNQELATIDKEIRERLSNDKEGFFDPTLRAKAREIVQAQPGTVMIYPLVLENKLWLLMYSEGEVVKKFEIPVGRQELGETSVKLRKLLQNRFSDSNEIKKTGKQLYDWLIKPIEPELKQNQIKHLVFSLDRVTRYIPMSVLFDGKQYLIENYTIDNVVSAAFTDMNAKLPVGTQNNPVLAMGLSNAVPGYNALPNVPAELDAIVQKNSNDKQGIYPGNQFINGAFDFKTLQDNLTGHKILHLATHGAFVPGSADKSYILLGTGEQLTIPKIDALTGLSNIHLVVLSACETALSAPNQDGIEIASAANYFLKGGAKAVMASLWLVDDASTSLMMQQFYKNWATGTAQKSMTKSEALRQAQLSLLQGKFTAKDAPARSILKVVPDTGATTNTVNNNQGFTHPYYWAPFILIGNGL